MTRTHAFMLALVKRYLKEFVPGPLRAEFDAEWAEADQAVSQDAQLHDWLTQKIARLDVWQGLLEPPAYKGGVLYGISTALFEDQTLRIKYRHGEATAFHHVHPLGLVKRDQVLYLVATFAGFNDPRLLSLHRIEMAFPTLDPPRRVPPDFDLAAFLEDGLPFEQAEEEATLDVDLLFAESAYASLQDRPPRGTRIESPAEGGFRVSGQVPNTQELRWWLLGFGDQVRIQAPRGLAEQLQSLLFDPLTGLLGRRATEEHLNRLLAAARRGARPLTLALVDVDCFKQVNDTHGHGSGDAVLQATARCLRTSCRDMDVVGRWGGEEFLLVWPDLAEQDALAAAERVRAAVAATPMVIGEVVTVSIGIRCVRPEEWAGWMSGVDGKAIKEELLKAADEALYQAKKKGRNQVQPWTPQPAPEASA